MLAHWPGLDFLLVQGGPLGQTVVGSLCINIFLLLLYLPLLLLRLLVPADLVAVVAVVGAVGLQVIQAVVVQVSLLDLVHGEYRHMEDLLVALDLLTEVVVVRGGNVTGFSQIPPPQARMRPPGAATLAPGPMPANVGRNRFPSGAEQEAFQARLYNLKEALVQWVTTKLHQIG